MLLSLLTGSTPPSPHIPLPPKDPPAIVQKAEVKHKIIKGDTLTKIAKEKNTTVERLFNKNTQLVNPDVLVVGIEITIPEPSEKLEPRIPPVEVEKPLEPTVRSSGNTYTANNCTWYAKSRRPDLPNNLGNANTWAINAQRQGFATGSTPKAGAIGQQGMHVVYIESVNGDGTVYLSEMNYDFNGGFRYRTASASDFVYIY